MTRSLRIEWRWLLGLLLVALLFVPARRFVIRTDLPFELDLYRIVLGPLAIAWLLTLLSHPDVRLRRTGLEAPLALIGLGVLGSLALNLPRVAEHQENVIKSVTVLATFVLVLYVTVSVVRTKDAVEALLSLVVWSGGVIAVLAIVEARTGWSPFALIPDYVPFLTANAESFGMSRAGYLRALGSAEHPIALSAVLALIVPIAAARAIRRRHAIDWLLVLTLVAGVVGTVSRTGTLMLIVEAAFLATLRWQEVRRFVPAAVIVLAVIHFAMPGALGALRDGLRPSAITAGERSNPGSLSSAGRVTDLAPSLQEFRSRPLQGHGFGTRITVGPDANARLLDNQWLSLLLDGGIILTAGFGWLFIRFVRRTTKASRDAKLESGDQFLLAAFAAVGLGYAVSMFTYDALAFIQVTFCFVFLMGLASALALTREPILRSEPRDSTQRRPAPTSVQPWSPGA